MSVNVYKYVSYCKIITGKEGKRMEGNFKNTFSLKFPIFLHINIFFGYNFIMWVRLLLIFSLVTLKASALKMINIGESTKRHIAWGKVNTGKSVYTMCLTEPKGERPNPQVFLTLLRAKPSLQVQGLTSFPLLSSKSSTHSLFSL